MKDFKVNNTIGRINGKAIKVTSSKEAKMILQSHVLTTAKYDFSVYEKRILYYCVAEAQRHLKGIKLSKNISIQSIIESPAREIKMPISAILKGSGDKNHQSVKEALYSLLDKKIIYEDHNVWTAFSMIQSPVISKKGNIATFTVNPILWQCILDFSKGFHPYELQVAMKFTSVYAMRFYEFVSNPQRGFKPEVSIETMKEWFCLENKYQDNTDFIKRVVKAAQKDLDKNSPWSFDFEPIKEGRKYTKIRIIPRECPENGDKHLQQKVMERRTNFSWDMPDQEVIYYLRDVIGFSTVELKNNRELWKNAYILLGDNLRSTIQEKYVAARALEKAGQLKTTTKAYVVGAMQKIVDTMIKENDNEYNKVVDEVVNSLGKK